MTNSKIDIEWIKTPFNLKEESEWEKYEERVKKTLSEEFGERSEEILEREVSRLLTYVGRIVKEQINTESFFWEEYINKKQKSLYEVIKQEIKEKEWIIELENWLKGSNEERGKKNNKTDEKSKFRNSKQLTIKVIPQIKKRNIHSRSPSLPPKLNLNKIDIEKAKMFDFKDFRYLELEENKELKELGLEEERVIIQEPSIQKEGLNKQLTNLQDENGQQLVSKIEIYPKSNN